MSKKNPLKGALILTAIALAGAALTYFVIRPKREASEKSKESASLLFGDLDRQKIAELDVINPSGHFQLKRKAENRDQWMVTNEKTFDAEAATVDGILSTILASKRESTVKNADLAGMGLSPPKLKLALPSEGAKRELLLGEDTPVDYFVYAKWSDKDEVFLTTRSLRFSLDKKLSELRNKKVFLASAKPSEVGQANFEIAAMDKHAAHKFAFVRQNDGWDAPAFGASSATIRLEKAEVEKFLDTISTVSVLDFVSEAPEDRAKMGFNRPLVKIQLLPADKKGEAVTWVLATARDPKAQPKAPGGGMKYYFARLDQPSTFEVSDTFKENFKVELFHFRPKVVTAITKADVKSFSIQDGTTQLNFTRENGGWKVRAKTPKKELEGTGRTDAIEKTLDALSSLKATEYLDEQSPQALGLRKPSRVVEVSGTKNGKDETLATVFFGRKLAGEKIVARTEALSAAAAVELKLEEALPMAPEHYMEATAPAAPAASANATPPKEGNKKVKLEATVKDLKEVRKLPSPIVKAGKKYTAEITMSKGGKIVVAFAPDKAPYTVSNFLHLARNGFYDSLKFHRVIPGFMAQGGDPTGTGTGGPGWKFDNEMSGIKHKRGVISMANAGPNTNGSQFFLMFQDAPHLDGGAYTSFGEITQGIEVLDAIQKDDTMKKVEVFEE